MDHVHFDDTKENNQATEAADDSVNTSVNNHFRILNQRYFMPLK